MTIKEIRERINEIKDRSSSNEDAHILEDKLYVDFIKSIAEDISLPAKIKDQATIVLEARGIKFTRWCA